MNKKLLAERIREYAPELAEALDESLFSTHEVAEELRFLATECAPVSDKFFNLMSLARDVEGS
jgi:hypothetical protein